MAKPANKARSLSVKLKCKTCTVVLSLGFKYPMRYLVSPQFVNCEPVIVHGV